MELKTVEVDARCGELGRFAVSSAVVGDGSQRPPPARGPDLYESPSTLPGSLRQHAWIGDALHHTMSTVDLDSDTGSTLFTGIAGEAWADAAPTASRNLDVPVEAVAIGPGRGVHRRP